jgi:hypothetical protein
MPIVGLTDRGPSFPQIGVLRKGAPKVGNGPGKDLEYFRFQTDNEEAAEAFAQFYGSEPRVIRVFVPYKTTNENFEAWREEWTASSLKHRCDGETCVRWLTPQGTYSDEPKPCPYLAVPNNKKGCKQVGRLQVVIPELKRLAYVTVLTTSINDILELHSNLQALEATRSDLRGIPLLLYRVPCKISTPAENGKRARREKWLLHVEAQPQWVELQLAAAQEAALPKANVQQFALPPAPAEEDDDDDEQIESLAPVSQPLPSTNGRSHSIDSAQENKINALLKAYCLKKKKNERAAQAWFDAKFGQMSAEDRRNEAVLLNLITMEQLAIDLQAPPAPDEAIEGEIVEEPHQEPLDRVSPAHLKMIVDKIELICAHGVEEAEVRAELEIHEEWRDLPQTIAIDVIARLTTMLGDLAKGAKK